MTGKGRDMPIEDLPSSYDVSDTELVYRSGHVIDVRRDVVSMPGGSTATRDVVQHPGAVGIIALDDSDRVLLLQQYRHPVRQMLWEPPAGLLDEPGEPPLETARRELLEEAHMRADRWNVLLDAFTSPGMSSEAVRLYLARDVAPADGPRYAGEHEEADMPVEWVPLEEAAQLVLSGALHNPLTAMGILAVLAARAHDWAGLRPEDAPWPQMGDYRGSAAAAQA